MPSADLRCLTLLVLLAGPAAATPPKLEPIPVRLGPASAVKDRQALEGALSSPLDVPVHVAVAVRGQHVVRRLATCAELGGELGGQLEPADPVDYRPTLSERVHCRALLWLRDARPARESFLGPLPLTPAGAGALPAALMFRHGAGRKRAAAPGSWRSVDPTLKADSLRAPPSQLRLHGRGYEALLSVYARGDFDGDGIEDTLIRRDAFASGGSYEEFSIFLITRLSPGAPLTVLRTFSEAY